MEAWLSAAWVSVRNPRVMVFLKCVLCLFWKTLDRGQDEGLIWVRDPLVVVPAGPAAGPMGCGGQAWVAFVFSLWEQRGGCWLSSCHPPHVGARVRGPALDPWQPVGGAGASGPGW